MKAVLIAGAFTAACVLAGPAAAQVSEAQQCVWSCLYGPGEGNPSSPAYNACVVEYCVGEDPAAQAAWSVGTIANGDGVFTNIDDPDSGRSLAWVCDRTGRSYFVLDADLEGPGGLMAIVVDGRQFPIVFERDPDWLEAAVVPGAQVLTALASGSGAQLVGTDGRVLGDFSLRGSSSAIADVRARCR